MSIDSLVEETAVKAAQAAVDDVARELTATIAAQSQAVTAQSQVVADLAARVRKLEAAQLPAPPPSLPPTPPPANPVLKWQGSDWTTDSAGRVLRDGKPATTPDLTIDVVSMWIDANLLFHKNKRGEVYSWSGKPDWDRVDVASSPPASPPPASPPPANPPAGATTVTVSGSWEQRVVGTWAATNDVWNITGWTPPLILGANLTQTVSVGPAVNGRTPYRIRAEIPQASGGPNSEIKTYPHLETGQPPGLRNLGTPNLPIRVEAMQSVKAGATVTKAAVNGVGHLSHDMRLMDTAEEVIGYWNAVPHILCELFVPVIAWGGYGSHPNGKPKDKFRGTVKINGADYHFYIQGGATATPQIIWIPAVQTFELEMAPLFKWAASTRYADLPLGPGGIFLRGRSASDTIIDGASYLTNNNVGIETVVGSFDVSGEVWFDVT